MTTSFEGGGKEGFDDGFGESRSGVSSCKDKHVGIVVETSHLGYFGNPAEGGANCGVFVECHGDAFSGAADGDSFLHFAALDSTRQGVGIVGIVATIGGKSAIVLIGDGMLVQIGLDKLLQFEACMVGSESEGFLCLCYAKPPRYSFTSR